MSIVSKFAFTSALLSSCALASLPALAQPATVDDELQQGFSGTEIDTIVVKGRAQRLYRINETNTTKLPSDPLTSSQIISSINAELIRDQGARDAQDLYRNIAGVSLFSYAGVTARGFRQEEIFFDGLRGDPYAGFSVPQLFNVQQIDFLKGPAGMLYGPGAPGGLFNYVTKKPSSDFSARTSLTYGTEGRYGGSAEVTGALPVDGVSARAGVFFEDRDTPRANTGSQTLILDLGLTADLGFAEVTLQGTRYEQDLAGNRLRGVPTDDDGNFLTDRRWNHNEPDDFLDLVSNNIQLSAKGNITPSLSWDAAVRYTDSREDQEYHEPRSLIDTNDDGVLDFVSVREYRDQTREEESISFGANAIWSESFGGVDNRLMVGMDYFHQDESFDYLRGRGTGDNIPGLSLVNPVYGQADRSTYDLSVIADGRPAEQTRKGAYVLNEATFGDLIFIGGVRFDDFKDIGFDGSKTTFRFGSVYRITDEISVFANWAESYEPQLAGDQDPDRGGPFAPSAGEIYEAGLKTSLWEGRLQANASVYRITRSNLLQATGVDAAGDGLDDLAPIGEVRSRGVDFDIAADITPDWVLTAAYGYNDTIITDDAGAGGTDRIRNRVGDRFANAPKHQLGFWTRYQVPQIDTAFAVGGDYVSDRLSLSGQTVKSYMVFDASVIWSPDIPSVGPVDVLLRVENLFDKTYGASGFLSRTGHFPGDPRSIFVEVSMGW